MKGYDSSENFNRNHHNLKLIINETIKRYLLFLIKFQQLTCFVEFFYYYCKTYLCRNDSTFAPNEVSNFSEFRWQDLMLFVLFHETVHVKKICLFFNKDDILSKQRNNISHRKSRYHLKRNLIEQDLNKYSTLYNFLMIQSNEILSLI